MEFTCTSSWLFNQLVVWLLGNCNSPKVLWFQFHWGRHGGRTQIWVNQNSAISTIRCIAAKPSKKKLLNFFLPNLDIFLHYESFLFLINLICVARCHILPLLLENKIRELLYVQLVRISFFTLHRSIETFSDLLNVNVCIPPVVSSMSIVKFYNLSH